MAESRDEGEGGFLSRWSRRKAAIDRGEAPVVAAPPVEPFADPLAAAHAPAAVALPAKEAPPPPTLEDVAALTKDSDFSRFVAADTDTGVKNAAMKKLFASDPHFNQMDGLDVYIDDYNKFEPIPKSILRQLVNARMFGLLDDELEEQPKPDNPPPDENAALQLQPDDAAGQPGAESGVADGGDRPEAPAPDAVPPRSA